MILSDHPCHFDLSGAILIARQFSLAILSLLCVCVILEAWLNSPGGLAKLAIKLESFPAIM
jgi:hypothetical protein